MKIQAFQTPISKDGISDMISPSMAYFYPDFGTPIHLGVLFIYAW